MVLQLRHYILVTRWHMWCNLMTPLCWPFSMCFLQHMRPEFFLFAKTMIILSFEWENLLPKEKYVLNSNFKSLENIWIVNTRDSILNYVGDKDQEIWGKKNHCHRGSWIRLPKEQTWDKGGLHLCFHLLWWLQLSWSGSLQLKSTFKM